MPTGTPAPAAVQKVCDWAVVAVAAAGILATTVQAIWTNKIQARLKRVEVTFLAKHKSYAGVVRALFAELETAANRPHFSDAEFRQTFSKKVHELEEECLSLEPFLEPDDRAWFRSRVGEAGVKAAEIINCYPRETRPPTPEEIETARQKFMAAASWLNTTFPNYLLPRLFGR